MKCLPAFLLLFLEALPAFADTPIPEITLLDLWQQHRDWIVALSILLLLLTAALARLGWQRRQLRLAESQLRQEKQHLADVIWATDVGTWEWNVQSGEVTFNERWAEIVGHNLADLGPLSIDAWNRLAHPDDLDRANELLRRCFRRETETYECEVRMRHRDGHWVWVQDRGRVVEWTPDGKPLRMSGTHQDISARKESEAVIAGSEARLRTIFGILPIGVALLDREGRIIECNAASEQMLGLGRAEFLVHKLEGGDVELFLPDGKPMPQEAYASVRAFAEGRPVQDVTFEVRSPTGSRWLSVSATPIEHPRYGMVMAYVDITQQRQAEARLQLAASVFSHAREGIVITDADACILDVNQAFTVITGYAREEVLGRNPRLLNSGWQTADFYAEMWRTLLEKGYWYGEVWNRRKGGEIYPEMLNISAVRDASGKIRHYVGLFSDITQLKSHQQQLEHIAHYDVLTNLPNRLLFGEHLHQAMAQAVRRDNQLAVIYLDLDGFKAINDQHGHNVGDSLLVALAHRMRGVLREGDILARLGGDEFAAVLVDLNSAAECQPVLARLLRAAADPVEIDEVVLRVSASIGYTLYPHDGADADQLLRHADQAMYSAKQLGKNCTCLFDVDQDAELQSQRETIEHIRRAFDRGEFVLHYQPRVNMKTGRVVGAEALIRWQHPQRGLLLPGEFLPVVENRPLGVAIGGWVINTALRQMAAWRHLGLDIPVSVNIASRQMQHADFVAGLRESLAVHPDVPPSRLELEVLETSLLDDLMHAREIMNACRELGVRFALDDFGTGYSSLTYLRRLPADILKIDQSFVRDMLDDPEDLAIIQGVLSLAKAFRREVVADGVETVEHGELLILMGCEQAQGFGIARPMPADDLTTWVRTWQPDPAWTQWRARASGPGMVPLLFAIVEHRHWLSALQRFLRGERREPPLLDRQACRFCAWFGNEGFAWYATDPGLRGVMARHERVHQQAEELLLLHARGESAEVELGLNTLHDLSGELTEALRFLAHDNAR
jgi:diguanylate cyclase (GGDEF)-like protein/PAS domain S-box-containing protein